MKIDNQNLESNGAGPPASTDEAKRFLDALFRQKEASENVLIWTLSDKRSAWFSDLDKAAAFVHENSARDVYVGVACSPQAHGAAERLKIENNERPPSSLSALFCDIDILGPGHQKQNLPPDEASAMSILFPEVPPSIVVATGGGIQAWYRLKEPWVLSSEEDVQKATALSKRFIRALRARAAARGWDVDAVGDLTRVLRVPSTTNTKIPDHPRPVVLRQIDASIEYDPTSIEHYLDSIGAAKLDTPVARGIVVGQLLYDPNADFSNTKFELVCIAEPNFKLSWDHKRSRRDLPDQSVSSYDLALANIAAQAGWSDQEICNLLIAHRRKYGVDLKLRDSYYVATIRKARELAGEVQVWSNIDEIIAAQEARKNASSDDSTADAPSADVVLRPEINHAQEAMKALDQVSQLLGIRIIQIFKYVPGEPSYRLKCEQAKGGELTLGSVGSLTQQGVFRDRIAALTNHRIPTFKAPEWDKVSRMLLGSVTDVFVGPDADQDNMVADWLDQYIDGLAIQDNIQNADSTKCAFRSAAHEGRICFYKAAFQRWCTVNHGVDKLANKTFLEIFKRLGIERITESLPKAEGAKHTSRSCYAMPQGYERPTPIRRSGAPPAGAVEDGDGPVRLNHNKPAPRRVQ